MIRCRSPFGTLIAANFGNYGVCKNEKNKKDRNDFLNRFGQKFLNGLFHRHERSCLTMSVFVSVNRTIKVIKQSSGKYKH